MQRIKIGKSLFLSGHGVDVATHIDYRGMGVYGKTRAHITDLEKAASVEFHYGIDTNPILIKRAKRENIGFPYSLERMARIRDVNIHLQMSPTDNVLIKKYGFYSIKILNKLKPSRKSFSGFNYRFEVSEIFRFDENYSIFWDRVKAYYKFIVFRDKDYMNWRYCDPRGGKYIIKMAKAGELVLGYIVLRINRYDENYPVGYIVDLLVSPDHQDVAFKLVEEGIRYFDLENINIIHVNILKKSVFEVILQKMGFIDIMSKPYLNIFKDNNNTIVDELYKCDVKDMHFFFGDWDQI
jgi:hypothetical protein